MLKGFLNNMMKSTSNANDPEKETVSLAISGMTCQIGCAKAIQSKLSKKEGVAAAVVVFTDSIATITFDSNKTSAENLSSFITGIAGGNLYTASEIRLNE